MMTLTLLAAAAEEAAAAEAAEAAEINHDHRRLAAPCLTTHHAHSTPLGKKYVAALYLGEDAVKMSTKLGFGARLSCGDAVRVSVKQSQLDMSVAFSFLKSVLPRYMLTLLKNISVHSSEHNYTIERY